MSLAVCLWCGERKVGALTKCSHCGAYPSTESDVATSLLLSDRYTKPETLHRFSDLIQSGQRIAADTRASPELLTAAREALRMVGRYEPNQRHIEGGIGLAEFDRKPSSSRALRQPAAYEASGRNDWNSFFSSSFLLILATFGATAVAFYDRNTMALIDHGEETVGEIVSYEPQKCGSRKRRHVCHYHEINAPPLGLIKIDLNSRYEPGTMIPISYERGNFENYAAGYKPTLSSLDFVHSAMFGLFGVLIATMVGASISAMDSLRIAGRSNRFIGAVVLGTAVIGLVSWSVAWLFSLTADRIAAGVIDFVQLSWRVLAHSFL